MNPLETYLAGRRINESDAMDALQQHGVVSDNCVWARDVANCQEAVRWLESNGMNL